MSQIPRSYSSMTQEALILLGKRIRLGRKKYRMSEQDLASRVGVARSTLRLIEQGAPTATIGLVFEAAVLTGVPLFVPEATRLADELDRVDDKLALMPKSIRPRELDNDF